MADPLWIAALLLAGLVVMVLEVFVPSGGVLGFLSVVALVAAVVMAFMTRGAAAGVTVLAIVCGAVPVALGMAFRFFPRTPLGRRVLPPPPAPEDVVPDVDRRRSLRDLVGRSGRAAADMLPWGVVSLGDVTHEAVSESGAIAGGAAVEVVGVQGAALVVRLRAAALPVAADRPGTTPDRPEPPPGGPHLSATLEEFDFDGLDRPET